MKTRVGLVAAALLLLASLSYAAGGGRVGAGHGGGGRHGAGGGAVARGAAPSGSRGFVAGPYGFGPNSSSPAAYGYNGYGYGGGYGYRNGYANYGYGRPGRWSNYYGNVGFGGVGVPLIYGTPYPAPVDVDPVLVPPPPAPLPLPPPPSGAATIAFYVPENALVWVNNQLLDQTGTDREFATPNIPSASIGTYSVRVRWTENGEEKSYNQRVTVRPGGRASVTIFSRSTAADRK